MNDKDMNGGEKTMKSNRKKRIIAAVLCMVMVLSSSISALAGEEIFVDIPEASEEFSSEPMVVTETESAGEAFTETEASPEISFSDGDVTADVETEAPVDPETPAEPAPEVPEEIPSEEAVPETPADEIPAEEENFADFGDGMSDSVADAQILSEETELKQEFVDEAGNVVQRVTAKLPAGAFAAETSSITMEVFYLDADSEKYLKSMMNENIPEGMLLGSYVFFNVQFKVNGEKAESLKPVEITIDGSGLTVTDTKKANVFYFDPADPSVEGDKDELKEIPQRSEVLESLQLAGQSTENIEDYDLSEITFREDGTTDKVIFEGRKSTIYGCYTEEAKPEEEIPAEPTPVPEEITPIPEEPETEEPAPETVSEIEIISDEVNLRTEPNAEADNVATVAYTGERFPLLENMQMEETLWYKIQYTYPETGETAELYVRSDFARIVDEAPEVSDDVDLTEEPGMVNELTYEDDKITVSVSAAEEGIIPDGASLNVKPITAENAETQEQYEEVAQHVEQKVAEEEKEVAGFLAYDISFLDAEGNKVEPNGEVKVSMNYKPAAIPESVQETGAENTEVSVLHLEENAAGEVQQVVDMTSENQVETLNTTEANEIQTVEMTTESFSVFTITWTYSDRFNPFEITVHYVDENGNEIDVINESKEVEISDSSVTINLSEYWRDAVDSQYEKTNVIKVDNINGSAITQLQTEKYYNYNYNYYTYYIKYKKSDSRQYTEWLNNWTETKGDIYFIYKKDSSSGGGTTGGGSSATGNLGHSKYVTYNNDGTYDLTLDVVGAVGTETNPAAVDIVFVLDLSGSMDGKNIEDAKSAVKTLTTKLNANKTVDSMWKLVTFSSKASVVTDYWVTASGINSIIQNYSDYDCDGGTNYEAGLTQAGKALGTARNNSTKIVIFLTDGEPTYHGTNTQGGGNKTYVEDYEGAIKGASTIHCNRFYAVGMGLKNTLSIYEEGKLGGDKWVRNTTGIQLLTDVVNAANCDASEGSRLAINVGAGESLDSVFANISGSITKYTATNVTITDKLTPEVDLVDSLGEVTETSNDLSIRVLNKDKQDVTEQEVKEGGIKAFYDSSTKEIKLEFLSDTYELKDGYTYSVTARIKPNEKAKEKYKNNKYSYPDTGEKGTGLTSEGKEGIFSNVENSAKVIWTTDGEVKEGKYNRPVVQIPEKEIPVELKKEPVNFFLNLSSSILDTDGNISGQSESAFTTSVSGSFSGDVNNPQGIGVAINTDLRVIVPEEHDHAALTEGGKVYGVIGGTSTTNAKEVDAKIRELGKENGTNGNQTGTEDEYYRIVNGSDQAEFPTDQEIFEYIKSNWNMPKTGVNKNQDITINENPIDKEKLTTENFAIRWYVFKDQSNGEYWHIDGILVPKSGVLTITKTFSDQEVADDVKNSFKIKVTGDFLGETNSTTIEKGLNDAGKPTVNSDGTVTYRWDLAVFGNSYTIEEVGYETASNSKWKYKSTEWTYTDADGKESKGTTTSSRVETQRTAEDETPKTQLFKLSNMYELANVTLDLKKFGTTYDNMLDGAKFELYTGMKNQDNSVTWESNPQKTISVKNEQKELELPEGYYKLKEVLAPSGYQLLGNEICFKISNRSISLIDVEGNEINSGRTDMWKLEKDASDGFILSILNEALYDLPSTGGNGIYVYMIGGVALMMAAMFILYKMKCKGVRNS